MNVVGDEKKDTAASGSIESQRIQLEKLVEMEFARFGEFVTDFATNLSMSGMFLCFEDPPPPGTQFDFRFSVANNLELIRGRAEVVWRRSREEAPDRPAGMGVRFLELDGQSKRLIRWLVEQTVLEGEPPFVLKEPSSETLPPDLGTTPATGAPRDPVGGVAADQPIAEPEPKSVTAAETQALPARTMPHRPPPLHGGFAFSAASERGRPLYYLVPVVLGLVVILLGGFWYYRRERAELVADAVAKTQSPVETAAAREGPATGNGDAAEVPPPASPTQAAPAPPAAAPSSSAPGPRTAAVPTATRRAVSRAVDAWASAWSGQQVDAYLAAYAPEFRPGRGLSRDEWERQRRERLTAPQFIEVAVENLEINPIEGGGMRARFDQTYRSDRYADTTLKELDLVETANGWRIVRERAISSRAG